MLALVRLPCRDRKARWDFGRVGLEIIYAHHSLKKSPEDFREEKPANRQRELVSPDPAATLGRETDAIFFFFLGGGLTSVHGFGRIR